MPAPIVAFALKKGVERFTSRGENKEKKPGSFKRKAVALGASALVVAGVAYGAKEYAENEIAEALPHDVGRAQVESTLGEVSLSGDTILLTGEGSSTSALSLQSESEIPFSDDTFKIPGTHMEATAEIEATLDVIAEEDAINLEAVKDEETDEWRVHATVEEDGLTSQLSNQEPTEFTNTEGIVNRLVNVFYEGNQPQDAASFLESIADNNFQAACGPELSEAVPAATASHVKNNIEQTASLLEERDPEAHEILTDLAENPIHVEFVSKNPAGVEINIAPSELDLDTPAPVESMNEKIDLPGGATEQYIDAEITTEGDKCEVDEETDKKLTQLKNDNNFVLEK